MENKWARSAAALLARKRWVKLYPNHILLIILVKVCVKKVFEKGRNFPWFRPDNCPVCGGRIWGHGFVPAFFDGFNQALWLRRYRCQDCGSVFRSLMNECKWVSPGITLNLSSAYRVLHQYGLMRFPQAAPVDRRKFEAALSNDLWQSDCMHGPMVEHLGKKKKTYYYSDILFSRHAKCFRVG